MTVTNPTPLPERADTPQYAVCAAGDWSEHRPFGDLERTDGPPVGANLNLGDGYTDHVLGLSSRTYRAHLFVDAANVTGERLPVERTSACPDDDTGEPYIAIYSRGDHRRPYPV